MGNAAKKTTGNSVANQVTSTKESTMNTAPKTATGKGNVNKANNRTNKTRVIEAPEYKFSPFVVPKEVVKLIDRDKGLFSMEHATQVAIAEGYSEELIHRLFQLRFKGEGKKELWIRKRSHKYYVQEMNHMKVGRIVKALHSKYQTTINRRAAAKKAAAKRQAKKAEKKA